MRGHVETLVRVEDQRVELIIAGMVVHTCIPNI